MASLSCNKLVPIVTTGVIYINVLAGSLQIGTVFSNVKGQVYGHLFI
jgi:hypothetical protein